MADNKLLNYIKGLVKEVIYEGITTQDKSEESIEKSVEQEVIEQETVIKAFQEEQRISVEIISEPNTPDLHGHWYSLETVQKGYESFDSRWKKGEIPMNLFHMKDDTEGTNVTLVKHYVMPCEAMIGETKVQEGTWVGEVKWHSEELWKARTVPREDGTLEIAGLSIKGWGVIHDAVEASEE